MTQIELLGDRVLVQPDPEDNVTEGGIIIPDSAQKERPQMGTVISTGPGPYDEVRNTDRRMKIMPGDRVLYGKYAGTDITLDDVEYVITTEKDILGIVRE